MNEAATPLHEQLGAHELGGANSHSAALGGGFGPLSSGGAASLASGPAGSFSGIVSGVAGSGGHGATVSSDLRGGTGGSNAPRRASAGGSGGATSHARASAFPGDVRGDRSASGGGGGGGARGERNERDSRRLSSHGDERGGAKHQRPAGSHSSSRRAHSKSVRFATTIDDGGTRTGSRGRYSPPPSPPRESSGGGGGGVGGVLVGDPGVLNVVPGELSEGPDKYGTHPRADGRFVGDPGGHAGPGVSGGDPRRAREQREDTPPTRESPAPGGGERGEPNASGVGGEPNAGGDGGEPNASGDGGEPNVVPGTSGDGGGTSPGTGDVIPPRDVPGDGRSAEEAPGTSPGGGTPRAPADADADAGENPPESGSRRRKREPSEIEGARASKHHRNERG